MKVVKLSLAKKEKAGELKTKQKMSFHIAKRPMTDFELKERF